MATLPLAGIRVLELGELLAGPFVGTILGEFGAEVIKIERPDGDVLRSFGPIVQGKGLFWEANARNKKSVVLDLDPADSSGSGFVRAWPGYEDAWIARHRGYALQWFSLAIVLVIIYVVLQVRTRGRQNGNGEQEKR